MKRVIVFLLMFLLISSQGGCGTAIVLADANGERGLNIYNSANDKNSSYMDEERYLVGEGEKGCISILFPTDQLRRWAVDGINLAYELQGAGYQVRLRFANNSINTQNSQIIDEIGRGADLLIITAIDGNSLSTAMAKVAQANVPVIAYDRLIKNCKGVSYYITFNNYKCGQLQGQFLEDSLGLKGTNNTYNLEILAGDPQDNYAFEYYRGAMDVIFPYVENGTINIPSNRIEFEDVAIPAWATETAQSTMENTLSYYYKNRKNLDAVLASNDSVALGATNALAANYSGKYPFVTGQDCDIENVKNIINGRQSMSVLKDTRTLARKTVEVAKSFLEGNESAIKINETTNNNQESVKTVLVDPIVVTKDNYQSALIASGYYGEGISSTIKESVHNVVTILGYSATCTEDGCTSGEYCLRCGAVIRSPRAIPSTGNHSWGAWQTIREATSMSEGAKVRTCSVCGSKQYEAIDILKRSNTSKAVTIKASKSTVPKGKKTTIKITSTSSGKITIKCKSKNAKNKKYVKISGSKITFQKKAPKGTYKFNVISAAKGNYKKTTKTISIKVK